MRNLKKILALALVFAMAFTFTASAADFTDKTEIGSKFVDDVNMLVELGVIAGYPDGSFGPQKNITRAEFCKMAYTIKYGSDTDGNLFAAQTSKFADVQGNANVAWAKGYINYCANQNIVSGKGANKFDPQGNITVAEATKMLLVILGCDPAKEGFTGANWVANVTAKAIDLGLYNGWTGDPSQLATRELVAKLMRNTIFSSVYTYSAITGVGSQMDALGQNWNQTLGEKTMGLQTVTGIVVANERYAIDTDAKGEAIDGTIDATGVDSEESVIYYESKDENGNTYGKPMTIDRALDDDMLGAKVDVYFKADRINTNGRIDYKNIEVLGNVIVNSDTVAYTIPSIGVDVYPNGNSTSSTTIRPYIGFTADGAEKKIEIDNVAKVAKKVDAQNDPNRDINAEITKFAYKLTGANMNDDGDLGHCDTFINNIGDAALSQYRFVSVDGGKTYSYMFMLVEDGANAEYGAVTAYNEAAGSIRIDGVSLDLEDTVLADADIAVDDLVVYYRANGKIVIEKAEAFSGAVESFTDDGVMLNGEEYFAWDECDLEGASTIFDYYKDNKNAMNAGTKYYAYGNLIMQLEANDEITATGNYAVVLRSYYDSNLDTAYVKLGFADNTEGTYKVGKLYTYSSSDLNHDKNNRAKELANNSLFGYVVDYKLRDDGSVDLSGQDFKEADSKLKVIRGGEVGPIVTKGKFNGYFSMNDATVLFALYGKPGMAFAGTDIEINAGIAGYAPVKAKAYKLADLERLTANVIPENAFANYADGAPDTDGVAGSYLLNKTTGSSKYIVAAAITVGEKVTDGAAGYDSDSSIAYVANARQYYNSETDLYYAQFTLIDENGAVTAYTVDDVENDASQSMLRAEDGIGKLDEWNGAFVRYELNADGKISMIDVRDDMGNDFNVYNTYSEGNTNKLVLVNIASVRGNVVSFYDTDDNVDIANESAQNAEYAEKGCTVIAIDEDAYAGTTLAKIGTRETNLKENVGNAVIYLDKEGEIEYIFSFANGFSVSMS